jgi:deoxyribonucleoside regulator
MDSEVYNQSVSLVLRTAYLYYLKDKSQREIADALSISMSTVSRLVKKARDEKIVEFVIRDPYIQSIEMEENLKKAFNLKDVVVAPIPLPPSDGNMSVGLEENARRKVALEGARYIQRIISDDDVLGVSWGKTIQMLINFLNPFQKINAGFVTMHGSIVGCNPDMDVRALVDRMSMAFGGRNYSLLSEGYASTKELKDLIQTEKSVSRVFEMFEQITVSLVSVGAFYPEHDSMLYDTGYYISESDLEALKAKDLVGDIFLRFFDSNGNECDSSYRDRTVGIKFDTYKKIKTKIVIAAGKKKLNAVLGAIRGGLVDVLITDCFMASALLELNQSK